MTNGKNTNLDEIKMQRSLIQNLEPPDLQVMGQQVNFCPECGTLLKIVNKGAPSLKCPKCRFKKMLNQNETPKINIRHMRPHEIIVIGKKEEASLRPLPTVKVVCPTCGRDESETWSIAVGVETGPSTVTFFRCTKCGLTRRETG
jgi:DNA-directed RNA polymerase subunit M